MLRCIIVQYIKASFLESISEDNYLSDLLDHLSLLLLTSVSNKKLRILMLAKKKTNHVSCESSVFISVNSELLISSYRTTKILTKFLLNLSTI